MIKIRDLKLIIIFILLLSLPIMNVLEIKALFEGTLKTHGLALTPWFIKIIKDFGMISIVILFLFEFFYEKKIDVKICCIIFLFLISIILTFISFDKLLPFFSIRTLLPLFLYHPLKNIVDEKLQIKISNCLFYLFLLNFLLQLLQFFKPIKYYGTIFNFSLRSPGFFIIPSSCAAFSLICLYYFYYYGGKNKFIQFLCFFSVILTASGTGIIILISVFLIRSIDIRNNFFIKVFLMGILIFLVLLLLPKLTGRSDILISLLTRINIFKNLNFSFFSLRSGLGTNIAVLSGVNNAWISDSQYIWLIGNFGIAPFLAYMYFIFDLKIILIPKYFEFFVIYLLLGVSLIYFELFPLNIIFIINILYFKKLKNKKSKYKQKILEIKEIV